MLEFQNVYFAYDKKQVFTDLSFTLANGEILAVMGESGCGKSTLLQLVAGFLKPQKGIIVHEACKISYAFQEPRLFPWLTVSENLRAVLSDKYTADSRIAEALDAVSLYGGDLYLLDEPFAALNEELRAELSATIRERIKQSGASAILVTHQRADAELMADRVLYL